MTDLPYIGRGAFLFNCAPKTKSTAVCILDSENNLWINKATPNLAKQD
jgi:hypothetical protein